MTNDQPVPQPSMTDPAMGPAAAMPRVEKALCMPTAAPRALATRSVSAWFVVVIEGAQNIADGTAAAQTNAQGPARPSGRMSVDMAPAMTSGEIPRGSAPYAK